MFLTTREGVDRKVHLEFSSLAVFADLFYLPSESPFPREIALQPELRSPESLALPKSCFKDIEGLQVFPIERARPFFYPTLLLNATVAIIPHAARFIFTVHFN